MGVFFLKDQKKKDLEFMRVEFYCGSEDDC